jgi:hypothetical protein
MTAAIAVVGIIAIEDAAGVEIGQMSAVEAEKRQMGEGVGTSASGRGATAGIEEIVLG